jgi:NADPH:quinone reductase-like Zn-dependent oxidoreductase
MSAIRYGLRGKSFRPSEPEKVMAAWADAWNSIVRLLRSGAIKPIVAKTFPLNEAADALRYLLRVAPSAGSSSQSDEPR